MQIIPYLYFFWQWYDINKVVRKFKKSMIYLLISCNTKERIAQNIYIHILKKITEELS